MPRTRARSGSSSSWRKTWAMRVSWSWAHTGTSTWPRGHPLRPNARRAQERASGRASPAARPLRAECREHMSRRRSVVRRRSSWRWFIGRTTGNPLFVREFVELLAREGRLTPETLREQRDWSVGVPEGLREVIGLRLDRLPPRCNDVLRLASIIGREFGTSSSPRWETGQRTSSSSPSRRRSLRASSRSCPRVPGRIASRTRSSRRPSRWELSTTRRIRLHARIASALEELYGDHAAAHAAELAYHSPRPRPSWGPSG